MSTWFPLACLARAIQTTLMPDLAYELQLLAQGHTRIAGIDEAGRGCLAGPVVAAAAVLPAEFENGRLNDSKLLSPRVRDELYEELTAMPSSAFAWAAVEAEEIDQCNILVATHRAMCRAFALLEPGADMALVDGLTGRGLTFPHRAVVKGDSLSLSIAAASIIAKVTRDRLMEEHHRAWPDYGFARHKGYGTPHHLERLRLHGPCPLHRRTSSPVARAIEARQSASLIDY